MRCVDYQGKYREQIIALFEPNCFKQALWQWQFEQNPWGEDFEPIVVVDDNDRVLGFNGVMPVHVWIDGKLQTYVWSCDFYVLSECRGQGIGQLIKHQLQEKHPHMMAFGVSDMADRVLKKMGWYQSREIYNFRYSRERDSLRAIGFTVLQYVNRCRGYLNAAVQPNLAVSEYRCQVSAQLPEKPEVDTLWRSVATGYDKTVDRCYDYLSWKYQRHPLAHYAFVSCYRAGLQALLVVRYHGQTLRLIDYIGPKEGTVIKAALLRFCQRHWHHAHNIVTTTSDKELAQQLVDSGFIRLRTTPRFFTFCADTPSQRCADGWLLMAGDSDGELLQAASDSGYRTHLNIKAKSLPFSALSGLEVGV